MSVDPASNTASADETVVESEPKYRRFLEQTSQGFAHYQMIFEDSRPPDFIYLAVNAAFEKLTGLHNVVGKKATELMPNIRQSDSEILETYGRVARTGQSERIETFVVALDQWFSISLHSPAQGQCVAIFDVITERKRAEIALQDAISLYHSLVEHLPQCIFREDLEGRFTYVNRRFCDLMGKAANEVLGKTLFDFFPLGLAQKYRKAAQEVMRSRKTFETIEARMLISRPRTVVHVLKAPVSNSAGEIIGVQGIFTDITSQTELEAKFLQAQRLESIGSLASGISHDLNNILAPIMMCTPMLRGETSTEERDKLLGLIEMSAQRAVGVVRQLLSFGRGGAGPRAALQVRHLLRETGRIARETFPRSIRVVEDVPSDLWLVSADPTQLTQMFLNLCINARDAMPKGGTLTLRARNVILDQKQADTHKRSPGPFIRIEVQDTGTGIPESDRGRIFDSFFTTKGPEAGTGLGLTTVLGLVKNHHGIITFTTTEGKGTTFEIHLPAEPQAQCLAESGPSGATPRGHGELILVVDDEPAFRDAERRALERHGFTVAQASDGIDALAQFSNQQALIRAVITDSMMPFMDGVTFCRAIRRLSPQTPIVVSAGGLLGETADDLQRQFQSLGIRHILHKPHSGELLLTALDEALHSTMPTFPDEPESP